MTWQAPSPEQVRAFLAAHNLSGDAAAEMAGLSGGNKVRAYTGGNRPAACSYAVWFVWHAKATLPAEAVAAVEAAMRASAAPDLLK